MSDWIGVARSVVKINDIAFSNGQFHQLSQDRQIIKGVLAAYDSLVDSLILAKKQRDVFNVELNRAVELLRSHHEKLLDEYGVDHWPEVTEFLALQKESK